MRKLLLMLMFVAGVSWPVLAQSTIVGSWKTIDDDTGKPKSVVEIYERGGKYYGKVTKLFRSPSEEQNPMCKSCDPKDKRYQQPVIGMEIIEGLEKDGDEYEDGTILDPENGKVYDCKLWVEDGNLQVRGYISFLFRTQTWLPYK